MKTQTRGVTLSPARRITVAATAGLMLALLVVAGRLQPDARGHGTHEQLGLASCTYLRLTGHPCPTCGMTTSWSHVVRGQVFAALRANVGGTLLALVAVILGPWLLVTAILGRPVTRAPSELQFYIAGVALMTITIVDWTVRVWL